MAAWGGTRRSSRDLPLDASPLPAYKANAPDARGPIPSREATAPMTSEQRSCLATPTVKCEPSKKHTVQFLSVPSRTGGWSPVWHGRRRETPLARRVDSHVASRRRRRGDRPKLKLIFHAESAPTSSKPSASAFDTLQRLGVVASSPGKTRSSPQRLPSTCVTRVFEVGESRLRAPGESPNGEA